MKLTDIIKNLIIEQATDSTPPTEEGMNKLKKHVGIYFLYLNSMADIEGYWQAIQEKLSRPNNLYILGI